MGFKMRSGNGPLAFKNMGSSPVLHTTTPDLDHKHTYTKKKDTKSKNDKNKVVEKTFDTKLKTTDLTKGLSKDNKKVGTLLGDKGKNLLTGGKTVKELASITNDEEVVDKPTPTKPKPQKHKGQVKKQEKLKDIQMGQDLKAYNKFAKKMNLDDTPEGGLASFDEWKKSDDYTDKLTTKEMNLKRRVGQTAEEYVEENREKMRRTVAGLREYGPGGSGSQTEGKAKYDAGKIAQSNKEKTQASQDIRDARTKQLTEEYDANLKKEGELASVPSAAGTEEDVEFESQVDIERKRKENE